MCSASDPQVLSNYIAAWARDFQILNQDSEGKVLVAPEVALRHWKYLKDLAEAYKDYDKENIFFEPFCKTFLDIILEGDIVKGLLGAKTAVKYLEENIENGVESCEAPDLKSLLRHFDVIGVASKLDLALLPHPKCWGHHSRDANLKFLRHCDIYMDELTAVFDEYPGLKDMKDFMRDGKLLSSARAQPVHV